jgi:hypothetical protein
MIRCTILGQCSSQKLTTPTNIEGKTTMSLDFLGIKRETSEASNAKTTTQNAGSFHIDRKQLKDSLIP